MGIRKRFIIGITVDEDGQIEMTQWDYQAEKGPLDVSRYDPNGCLVVPTKVLKQCLDTIERIYDSQKARGE